jgi:hypothetical protein
MIVTKHFIVCATCNKQEEVSSPEHAPRPPHKEWLNPKWRSPWLLFCGFNNNADPEKPQTFCSGNCMIRYAMMEKLITQLEFSFTSDSIIKFASKEDY